MSEGDGRVYLRPRDDEDDDEFAQRSRDAILKMIEANKSRQTEENDSEGTG